jgi:c-di-GMP-binding flagellar brake protein YcgR
MLLPMYWAGLRVSHGFGHSGGELTMDLRSQYRFGHNLDFVETRRHPRFKLDADICIYPRNARVIRGHSVDISESGISAMLRDEVPIGEIVRLEFKLPLGAVDIHATVCQRNAFRYGFQFVESSAAQPIIARTCRQLALEQSLFDAKQP